MVVMVQEEVAQSMGCRAGEDEPPVRSNSILCGAKFGGHGAASGFPPAAEGGVGNTAAGPSPQSPGGAVDEDAFFNVVRAGFWAPRKQLRNSLSRGLGASPAAVGSLLETLGMDGSRRPATLSLEEWALILHGWERVDQLGSPSLRQD